MNHEINYLNTKESRRFKMKCSRIGLGLFGEVFEQLDLCGEWLADGNGTVRLYVGDNDLNVVHEFPFAASFELSDHLVKYLNHYIRSNNDEVDIEDYFFESYIFNEMPEAGEPLIYSFMKGLVTA